MQIAIRVILNWWKAYWGQGIELILYRVPGWCSFWSVLVTTLHGPNGGQHRSSGSYLGRDWWGYRPTDLRCSSPCSPDGTVRHSSMWPCSSLNTSPPIRKPRTKTHRHIERHIERKNQCKRKVNTRRGSLSLSYPGRPHSLSRSVLRSTEFAGRPHRRVNCCCRMTGAKSPMQKSFDINTGITCHELRQVTGTTLIISPSWYRLASTICTIIGSKWPSRRIWAWTELKWLDDLFLV